MMGHIEIYVWLLAIVACIGLLSTRVTIPTPFLLVMAGMLLSFIPDIPSVHLDPDLVLNIFLPLLVYSGSKFTSWSDFKGNKRPIALLSIGHVLFITLIIGVIAHHLLPGLPWAVAFLLGAVISPPDDVAIFAIADKIYIPQRLLTVLMGESLLNDATALTLFRFALAAAITHQFSAAHIALSFFAVIIGETAYGVVVGHLMGKFRLRIKDPVLQVIFSILTPFVAYIPAVRIGGCGVLATVVTGLIISHSYSEKFRPDVRMMGDAVWETLSFIVQSILFLLVGLNFETTIQAISYIPLNQLLLLGSVITLAVIIGRFLWVYPATYLPRLLFKSVRQNDPYPPWQFPFLISWAGMRGGVSLAAAIAIPHLALQMDGVNLRELIIFLTFCVIMATLLLQGLSLSWVIRKLGLSLVGKKELQLEQMDQLGAKLAMTKAVLNWLNETAQTADHDPVRQDEIRLQTLMYRANKIRLQEEIQDKKTSLACEKPQRQKTCLELSTDIIEVERKTLMQLWHDGRINLRIKNMLMQQLDLHARRLNN